MTVLYSALHFLVDGVCAWAMLGRFGGDLNGFLIYNFCAFAMQLPMGAVLDRLGGRKTPLVFAGAGCALTLLGVFCGPVVLGLGNGLFHVGGGADVIRAHGRCGPLGVFVAPGALGLYLGGRLAGKAPWLLLIVGIGMALLLPFAGRGGEISTAPLRKLSITVPICAFAVVVLRSYVGMAVSFPWKTGLWAAAAVAAVVLGKAAGGVLAERFGMKRVTACSLLVSAVCFALGDVPVFGLAALLCFNMTMPLTLYALWRRFPEYPGTVFGALTLALFLGFLPVAYGLALPLGGAAGSLISLALLWKAVEDG